jgi:hypothetical protein
MSEQNDDKNNWKINGAKAQPEKLPLPTVWPATLSLGVTMMAFGIVTSWVMSVSGAIIFLCGAAGWVEDLRND